MTKNCAVCGTPAVWQGLFNPVWVHVDPVQEADHPAIYVPPVPRQCCGGE